MPAEAKRKRPNAFGIKVVVAVMAVSLVLVAVIRLTGETSPEPEDLLPVDIGASGDFLVPEIKLPVSAGAYEREWTHALARELNGRSEIKAGRGRADVVTDVYAIEIDVLGKWKEGLGQALYYAERTNRIGVLALIRTEKNERDLKLLREIESLCVKKGVKLILLKPLKRK